MAGQREAVSNLTANTCTDSDLKQRGDQGQDLIKIKLIKLVLIKSILNYLLELEAV